MLIYSDGGKTWVTLEIPEDKPPFFKVKRDGKPPQEFPTRADAMQYVKQLDAAG